MAEPTQFLFDFQEVLEDLIKRQGLHEGRWKIICELGFAGTNAQVPDPNGEALVKPAAMVLIQRIGITKTEEVNNLTLDAAVVNPSKGKAIKSKPSVGTSGGLAMGKARRKP
jgi:hypothetical protein